MTEEICIKLYGPAQHLDELCMGPGLQTYAQLNRVTIARMIARVSPSSCLSNSGAAVPWVAGPWKDKGMLFIFALYAQAAYH